MPIISSHLKLSNTHIYIKINMVSIQHLHNTIEVIVSLEKEHLLMINHPTVHHNQYIKTIRIFHQEVMVNIVNIIVFPFNFRKIM